jgi:hypothetical protein
MADLTLPEGHTEIIQKADDPHVEAVHEGTAVRLLASLRYHLAEGPLGPGRHRRETTVAIHMDPKAAMELAAKLLDLGRSWGWPLPPQAGSKL